MKWNDFYDRYCEAPDDFSGAMDPDLRCDRCMMEFKRGDSYYRRDVDVLCRSCMEELLIDEKMLRPDEEDLDDAFDEAIICSANMVREVA